MDNFSQKNSHQRKYEVVRVVLNLKYFLYVILTNFLENYSFEEII
jgi:hypothetical protein